MTLKDSFSESVKVHVAIASVRVMLSDRDGFDPDALPPELPDPMTATHPLIDPSPTTINANATVLLMAKLYQLTIAEQFPYIANVNQVDYAQIFISLIAIVNPLMGVPMFVSLTNQMTSSERDRAARSTALTVCCVLAVSVIAGDTILGFFGIDVIDFSIAGGILILLMAINMLNARPDAGARISPDERLEAAHRNGVAIVPLGIPLLAGPGAISTAIIVADMAPSLMHRLILLALCAVIGFITYFTLRVSRGVSRLMGITGMNIVSRIMGLLLAAIAVSFMANGIQRLFPILNSPATSTVTESSAQ